jgi:prohibitin 2
MPMRLIKFTRD